MEVARWFRMLFRGRLKNSVNEIKTTNNISSEKVSETLGGLNFAPYTPEKMNKLAFMCATGSGKTLIMHMNILQFLHYFKRAKRINSWLSVNKIIVLAPNPLYLS